MALTATSGAAPESFNALQIGAANYFCLPPLYSNSALEEMELKKSVCHHECEGRLAKVHTILGIEVVWK